MDVEPNAENKDVLLCEEDWRKSAVTWGSAPDK